MRFDLKRLRRCGLTPTTAPPEAATQPLTGDERATLSLIAPGIEGVDALQRWCQRHHGRCSASPYVLGGWIGMAGTARLFWAAYGPDAFTALARAVLAAAGEGGVS